MPNQISSYQKVVEVVAGINFDHDARAILVHIAKTHPQVVVDAANHLNGNYPRVVTDKVIDYLLQGRKIEAIKQHRQDTGLGLKDAKDAIYAVIANDRGLNLKYNC